MKLQLLTTGAMANAIIAAAPTAATGHPWQNVFNDHLTNYWIAPDTTSKTADIDLGSAHHIDGVAVFVPNYTSNFASASWLLRYSDDDFIYDPLSSGIAFNLPAVGSKIKLFGPYTGASHRYWEVYIAGTITVLPQISRVMLFREFAIDVRELRDGVMTLRHFNDVNRGPGGVCHVKGMQRQPAQRFERTYRLLNASDIAILQAAYEDSCGSSYPLILVEDEDYTNAVCVKFMSSPAIFKYRSPVKATIDFELQQLPFVAAGDYV